MKPILDRIDFQPDQCLAGADLTQATCRTAELLQLHAARGHDVWGVVTGFLCSTDVAGSAVVVGPGVALDACGHQLINPADYSVPVPNVPDDGRAYLVDLIARCAPTADLADGCRPGQMPVERVHIRWEFAGPAPPDAATPTPYSSRVHLGADVPIARFTTASAAAAARVSTSSRPVAHALVRPKIATGHIPQSAKEVVGSYADWHMEVSTASAGFEATSSPVYLVSLDAHPFGPTASLRADTQTGVSQSANTGTGASRRVIAASVAPDFPPDLATRLQTWVGPFVSIPAKDNASFTLRVVTANGDWAQKWSPVLNPVPVSWVGIDTRDAGPFSGWLLFLQQIMSSAVLI
jgi:hypothetical protein